MMSEEQRPGGLSETKDADGNICGICEKMKPEAEKRIGKKFETFTPKSYRDQIVGWKNYFIKVHVGDDVYAHLRVHEKLDGGLELYGAQHPKTLPDPIEYF